MYEEKEHVHGVGFSDKLAVTGCAIVQEYEIVLCYEGVKWGDVSEDRRAKE